ncbi:glucose/sorbosone dehydrogenase [Pedobacter sp. BAL39]|uniref:PQQ-dependent sugar dehydrogenase n=1 Tax=Pedobacter sp. BAL39 TaxID=391596 RepID=UPI000155AC5E|nr:PQQ-dependent sugar dehydrogenase [Pedobacter sp. BAL39]EDM34462.1 glucose/sorbosone dehydrogenase [Pedobacter sp. BAL39]
MKHLMISALVLLICCTACKKNKSDNGEETLPDVDIKTRVVASGLSNPWEMIYGPDGLLWITERSGKISRVNPQTGAVTLLHTVSDVVSNGEGGLLGMALHPNFTANPYVYVVYNYNSSGNYREKVVRFSYANNALSNPQILLQQIPAANIHNGSRLLITSDQKLLISTGDANVAENAQNKNSLSGKILRINLDGSIPADNPVAGNPMWSFGHRNAQGLIQVGDRIYASEHGPDSDDEINLITKGKNYGWPNVKGFCNEPAEQTFCAANDVAEPLKAWTPTIATASISYYNSDYIPQWKNSLLLMTLKGTRLVQLKLNEAGTEITASKDFLDGDFGRLRAITQSPDGKVYISSSNGNDDKIIEIAK